MTRVHGPSALLTSIFATLFLTLPALAGAQTTLAGVVKDTSGAVLPV
jgi:hypothetical protein